jgi:hypothetical protein
MDGCPWVLFRSPPSIGGINFEGIEIGHRMTAPHLRILAAAALHSQRRLDAVGDDGVGSAQRHRDLMERAERTKSRLAAARARRRLPPNGTL